MANFCIMRVKKLKQNANVGASIQHALRLRETPNSDITRTDENWCNFKGSPEEQLKAAMSVYKSKLPEKVRKNGVRAVELMMTASPESFKKMSATQYLNACDNWARKTFGKDNICFIAHHYDEKTPHTSIILVPRDDKGRLNCRFYLGGRDKLQALQTDFYQTVGKEFGLNRGIQGSKAKHKDIKTYYSEIQALDAKFSLPKRQFLEGEEEYQKRAKIALRPVLAPLVGLENEKLKFKQEVSNSLKYLKSEKARLEDEKQEIKNIKDTYYALKYNSPEFLRRKADELEQQKKNQTKERKQGYER